MRLLLAASLRRAVRGRLRGWPLYSREHTVDVRWFGEGVWIGYRTSRDNIPAATTHFDVNVIGRTFYVLHIEIEESQRGHGYGQQLYQLLEDLSRDLGCREIRQTPSGRTLRGDSRAEYLERRGYRMVGVEAVKTWDTFVG